MKGLKIEKAKPSNAIDIYALLKDGVKEGLIPGKPTERQIKHYYFAGLLNELAAPNHLFFVAKRGRGYLGFIHAFAIPGRWDGTFSQVFVDLVYVVKHRRKNGVGKKLVEALKNEVENIGIKKIEFACPPEQAEYWGKECGAKISQIVMGVNL